MLRRSPLPLLALNAYRLSEAIAHTFANADEGGGSLFVSSFFGASALESRFSPFRDNEYIQRLNQVLQAELAAVTVYRQLAKRPQCEAFFEALWHAHQEAGRELVKIVVANRGLPAEKAAFGGGFAKTVIHLAAAMPSWLNERTTVGTLLRLERHLASLYERLLGEAPLADSYQLEALLSRTQDHQDKLSERC